MVTTKEIKTSLLERIDNKNPVQVEKVERYCRLIDLMQKLMTEVEESEVTKTTENGYQKFTKAHPALPEINKINAQLINLEKSFEYKTVTEKVRPSLK